jgi:GWxTD domain-containing protein
MSKADKRWLEQDVAVLITEEERAIYKDLETEAERAIFKRIFWARRDPTPLTLGNEFKNEYEARLQILRRNLKATGRSSTATDMGRVFLLLGDPAQSGSEDTAGIDAFRDETDVETEESIARKVSRSAGTPSPTGGVEAETPGFPSGGLPTPNDSLTQTWVYLPNEALGIPDGLVVRFREQDSFGYRLIPDNGVEEILANVQRSVIANPRIAYARDANGRLLDLETAVNVESTHGEPSPILMALRRTRVVTSEVPFQAETAFFPSNDGTVFVPVVFDIDAAALSWSGERASATVVGLVDNDRSETVQRFEESATLVKRSDNRAVFEMPLQLDPGDYTLYLGVRDDTTTRLGTKILPLTAPAFTGEKLRLSTVLLFSDGKKTEELASTPGKAFIIGGYHFIPHLGRIYETSGRLTGVFMAHGFGVENGRPNLTVQYIFHQNNVKRAQTQDEPFISAGGTMAITVFNLPLGSFDPGEYSLRIKVTDHIGNEVTMTDIDFTVEASESSH